ncbi:caspase family protein [Candidatus Venteria ishoeyi]|uniref:Caspase domain protein n=1 Tax=Candidatus Venteria ishoeyi TaxID=1899563 RepID=A0A1H6F9Z7_9GAMM|nr:caspase family protein [Candidatus Venteria ishoeyi]SEH06922.1 Caspase domain protein [Candidatus Venteria ishoeyi]
MNIQHIFGFCCWLLCGILSAQADMPSTSPEVLGKVALVIGNADYPYAALNNARNDAEDIAAKLQMLGFDVILKTDSNRHDMLKAVRQFGEKLQQQSAGVFYYSGHALQFHGQNYLLAAKTPMPTAEQLDQQSLSMARILDEMSLAENTTNILIIDACRDNPFVTSAKNPVKGLAKMAAPPGTLIAYATTPGSVAEDGKQRNSPYTRHLLSWLGTANLTVGQMFNRVRDGVILETNKRQVPSEVSYLRKDFYFAGKRNKKQLAAQETERLLQQLRDAEAKKRQQEKQQKYQQQLQTCLQHEQAMRLLDDKGQGAALPCYQTILQQFPQDSKALERLHSLALRYLTWTEAALRHTQWQRAETYLQGLQKINPKHVELPVLQAQLKSGQAQQAETQQIEALSIKLLGVDANTHKHVPVAYWETDKESLLLQPGQSFIYYLPLPRHNLLYSAMIEVDNLPTWLKFEAKHAYLYGQVPDEKQQMPIELRFSAHLEQQVSAPLFIAIKIDGNASQKRIKLKKNKLTEPLNPNVFSHNPDLFQEIVVRIFTQLGYWVVLTEDTKNTEGYYPVTSTETENIFYVSRPLLMPQQSADESPLYLHLSRQNPQHKVLMFRFNQQHQQLQQAGWLAWIKNPY